MLRREPALLQGIGFDLLVWLPHRALEGLWTLLVDARRRDDAASTLVERALELGLEPLVEAHDEREIEAALADLGYRTIQVDEVFKQRRFADPQEQFVGVMFAQHLPYDEHKLLARFRTLAYQALLARIGLPEALRR